MHAKRKQRLVTDMSFSETVLPVDVQPGATTTSAFNTTVVTLRSGGEYRNQRWANPLRNYEVTYGSRNRDQIIADLQTFMLERSGAFQAFRARDWSDYVATDEPAGTGDGSSFWFRMYKGYGGYQRRILKVDEPTVTVEIDGALQAPSSYAIEPNNGIVILATPPVNGAVITWSGEFHVPVRFEDDDFAIRMLMHTKGVLPTIGLKEVRVYETIDEAAYATIQAGLTP